MDDLVAVAIHDAKNALNALGMRLDEAGRDCPSAAIGEARALAARISAQLVELLAIYRAGEGTLRLAIDDQLLEDFLADTVAEFDLPPRGKIGFACDPAAAGAIGSWAFDAYLVRFVLLDALRNALRHAQGRVTLSAEAEPGGGLRFTVGDDGAGFPAEVLRGEAGAMSETSSGLGLAFAQLIAERHATPDGRHGRVELANGADGGARFSLILP